MLFKNKYFILGEQYQAREKILFSNSIHCFLINGIVKYFIFFFFFLYNMELECASYIYT